MSGWAAGRAGFDWVTGGIELLGSVTGWVGFVWIDRGEGCCWPI